MSPFVGIRYGTELSRRAQKDHWIADNQKEEYREVLAAITNAYIVVVRNSAPMVAYGPKEQREREDAERRSLEAIRNRLFIATDLEREKIPDLWSRALHDMDHNPDIKEFKRRFEEIEALIRKLASKSIT